MENDIAAPFQGKVRKALQTFPQCCEGRGVSKSLRILLACGMGLRVVSLIL